MKEKEKEKIIDKSCNSPPTINKAAEDSLSKSSGNVDISQKKVDSAISVVNKAIKQRDQLLEVVEKSSKSNVAAELEKDAVTKIVDAYIKKSSRPAIIDYLHSILYVLAIVIGVLHVFDFIF